MTLEVVTHIQRVGVLTTSKNVIVLVACAGISSDIS